MIALPSFDEPMFHNSGDEKSSLKEIEPRPGFRSGVGRGVASVTGEGVAEGGNHTMVGEGALAAGSAAPVAVESAGRLAAAGVAHAVRLNPAASMNVKGKL